MAQFGRSRDISVFRHVNRELLGNIITQQVAFYKVNLEKTTSNIYGESVGKRFFSEPTLLNCLIVREDPKFEVTDMGPDYTRVLTFRFLRDDLTVSNTYPEPGDVIMYYNSYYELEQVYDNQLFVGKDPDYNYAENPLNPGLEEYGYSVSINCVGHYTPGDKLGITKER